MTTYDSATGAKIPTPSRAAVESLLGQPLFDWQWNTMLGVLGHLPSRPPAKVSAPALPTIDKPVPLKKLQDHPDFRHTCEICGRVGTRRFRRTTTGWRCTAFDSCERRAATATAEADAPATPEPTHTGIPQLCTSCGQVGGPQPHVCPPGVGAVGAEDVEQVAAQPAADDLPADNGVAAEPPADDPVAELQPGPSITARCQDCTRTFTLTGRALLNAVNMHEFKKCHIVTVLEAQGA